MDKERGDPRMNALAQAFQMAAIKVQEFGDMCLELQKQTVKDAFYRNRWHPHRIWHRLVTWLVRRRSKENQGLDWVSGPTGTHPILCDGCGILIWVFYVNKGRFFCVECAQGVQVE